MHTLRPRPLSAQLVRICLCALALAWGATDSFARPLTLKKSDLIARTRIGAAGTSAVCFAKGARLRFGWVRGPAPRGRLSVESFTVGSIERQLARAQRQVDLRGGEASPEQKRRVQTLTRIVKAIVTFETTCRDLFVTEPDPSASPSSSPQASGTPSPSGSPSPSASSSPVPTPTPASSFQAALQLSRTSGVAPLAVFADGEILTSGLTGGDFLNADFAIDFDATGINPNGIGRKTHGFLSGHVYTQPGTYQVKMEVVDNAGRLAIAPTVAVTVQNPEEVFMPPLGSTYCFSTTTSANFTGCPVTDPSKRIVTNSFQQALQFGGANRRLLFRRGDIWYSNSAAVVVTGPQLIAAYPDPLGSNALRPQIISNAGDWTSILQMDNSSDVRVADLQLTGNFNWAAEDPKVGGISANASTNALVYNNILERLNHIGVYLGYNTDALSVVNNIIRDSGQYGMYGGAHRLSVLRNEITNLKFLTHGIRVQGGERSVLCGNRITNLESFTSITMRGNNDRIVLCNNLLEAVSTIAPQNDTSEEYVSNALVDGNVSRPRGGVTTLGTALNCTARAAVIRNNVWLNTSLGVGMGNHPLVGACTDADIYNNTFYNATNVTNDEHHLLYAASLARRISAFNNIYFSASSTNWGSAISFTPPLSELTTGANLYYAPNQGPQWLQFYVAGTGYSLSTWQAAGQDAGSLKANPQFQSVDPASPFFLRLALGSPAVDSGLPMTNLVDAAGETRPKDGDGSGTPALDRGAFER